jgi:hypothetical protein
MDELNKSDPIGSHHRIPAEAIKPANRIPTMDVFFTLTKAYWICWVHPIKEDLDFDCWQQGKDTKTN